MWFLRPFVNPLFWCIFSKTSISPRRNYHFWGLWEFSKYSTWHVLIPVLVTATLRVLPRTFADLDCLRYNASTTWTHIVSLTGASSNAHGLCVSKPCELARNLSKTSKTGPTFVCNVGNTTKHLRSFRCKILYLMNYTLYRDTTAFCGKLPSSASIRANDAGPVQAATDKHVLPPQVHMNAITCPTPPHPHLCIHAPTGSHRQAPQVHMNVITCPTPPHHTPPVHTCTCRQPRTSMSFLRKFTWTLLHAPPHPTPPMCTNTTAF